MMSDLINYSLDILLLKKKYMQSVWFFSSLTSPGKKYSRKVDLTMITGIITTILTDSHWQNFWTFPNFDLLWFTTNEMHSWTGYFVFCKEAADWLNVYIYSPRSKNDSLSLLLAQNRKELIFEQKRWVRIEWKLIN